MSNSEGMHSPVEQFEIKPLVELSLAGYDVSFTNGIHVKQIHSCY